MAEAARVSEQLERNNACGVRGLLWAAIGTINWLESRRFRLIGARAASWRPAGRVPGRADKERSRPAERQAAELGATEPAVLRAGVCRRQLHAQSRNTEPHRSA